ncbi:MAG: S8 family serine peptidase, partial [Bifidobacteriaceae bacterium]|nr:S8 family serine peptidase [Bifidobacteriaceae bacterium]
MLHAANQILLRTAIGAGEPAAAEAAEELGGTVAGSNPYTGLYTVLLDARKTRAELEELVARAESLPGVKAAALNFALEPEGAARASCPEDWYCTNDARWKDRWTTSPSGGNWGLEAINAPNVWRQEQLKANYIDVGIYDSGFDLGHEDLHFTWTNRAEWPEGADHGTHVAGIIGARVNNGKGVAGVAPNVNVLAMSIFAVMADNERRGALGFATVSNIEIGLCLLVAVKRVRVLNLSLGILEGAVNAQLEPRSRYAQDFRAAIKLEEDSVLGFLSPEWASKFGYSPDFLIVKAAGNGTGATYTKVDGVWRACGGEESVSCGESARVIIQDAGTDFFASATRQELRDRVIVVGAAELDGDSFKVAGYSAEGSRVDLIAPGTDIESTVAGGRYGTMSGTSMAAPHVTGAAAAVLGADPGLTGPEVKCILTATASSQTYSSGNPGSKNSYRMLDAAAAVNLAWEWTENVADCASRPEPEESWELSNSGIGPFALGTAQEDVSSGLRARLGDPHWTSTGYGCPLGGLYDVTTESWGDFAVLYSSEVYGDASDYTPEEPPDPDAQTKTLWGWRYTGMDDPPGGLTLPTEVRAGASRDEIPKTPPLDHSDVFDVYWGEPSGVNYAMGEDYLYAIWGFGPMV